MRVPHTLQVVVVVESEDMRTGVRHHCCSAHLTFVVRPHGPHAPTSSSSSSSSTNTVSAAGASGTATITEGAAGGAGGGNGGGGNGSTALLPRVYPTGPELRAVWEGAEARRQQRLEARQRLRRSPELQAQERLCRWAHSVHGSAFTVCWWGVGAGAGAGGRLSVCGRHVQLSTCAWCVG